MTRIRVKIGTLVYEGNHYSNGDEFEIEEKELKRLDKRDYEVVEEKPRKGKKVER